VWGALDSGTLHVPQRIEVQAPTGDGWSAVEGQRLEPGEKGLVTIRLPGENLGKLRLLQPEHGGSQDRPDLMWISEVEVE